MAPGDTLSLNFAASADSLAAFSEIFQQGNATFSSSGSSQALTGHFEWIPDSSHSRLYPYVLSFRGTNVNLQRDLTVLVYVTGGNRPACSNFPSCYTFDEPVTPQDFSITPNPFYSSCKIKVSGAAGTASLSLSLYDLFGRRLYSLPSGTGEFTIQRDELDAGLYLFKIHDKNLRMVSAGKIIAAE